LAPRGRRPGLLGPASGAYLHPVPDLVPVLQARCEQIPLRVGTTPLAEARERPRSTVSTFLFFGPTGLQVGNVAKFRHLVKRYGDCFVGSAYSENSQPRLRRAMAHCNWRFYSPRLRARPHRGKIKLPRWIGGLLGRPFSTRGTHPWCARPSSDTWPTHKAGVRNKRKHDRSSGVVSIRSTQPRAVGQGTFEETRARAQHPIDRRLRLPGCPQAYGCCPRT